LLQYSFFGVSAAPAQAQTIVDVATGDEYGETFSTLVDFVVEAELAGALSDESASVTVFAPTNDAFAELPAYVADALERNPELLTDILLYHVAGEELMASDVLAQSRIETLQGESLRVNLQDGDPYVDRSAIIVTDVDASNGVVHAIDRVLIPNSVYKAVVADMRAELRSILESIQEVRMDQLEKVRLGSDRGHGWGNR
jgi:uncharacterized surface protein with fasciclin (FAS1) repeats